MRSDSHNMYTEMNVTRKFDYEKSLNKMVFHLDWKRSCQYIEYNKTATATARRKRGTPNEKLFLLGDLKPQQKIKHTYV